MPSREPVRECGPPLCGGCPGPAWCPGFGVEGTKLQSLRRCRLGQAAPNFVVGPRVWDIIPDDGSGCRRWRSRIGGSSDASAVGSMVTCRAVLPVAARSLPMMMMRPSNGGPVLGRGQWVCRGWLAGDLQVQCCAGDPRLRCRWTPGLKLLAELKERRWGEE